MGATGRAPRNSSRSSQRTALEARALQEQESGSPAALAVEFTEGIVAELDVALATAGIELEQCGSGDRDRAIG